MKLLHTLLTFLGNIDSVEKIIQFSQIVSPLISLFLGISSLFLGFLALYFSHFRVWFRRPRLNIFFPKMPEEPYFHNVAFDPFSTPMIIDGQDTNIFCPGFNVRLKVLNKGKTTAKNVIVRLEKVEIFNDRDQAMRTCYYHPTLIKWSGEMDWKPVDVVPHSYFLLDLFWVKNETTQEIVCLNGERIRSLGINLDEEPLRQAIEKRICPSQDIYWGVWVDRPSIRGIPERYLEQGKFVLHFIVNAENCAPLRFLSFINWKRDAWNQPVIKVKLG